MDLKGLPLATASILGQAPGVAQPPPGFHDIQTPLAVSWWPPAPGWWLLGVLLFLLLTGLILRRWHLGRPRREALAELRRLEKTHGAGFGSRELAAGISTLLRRAALARDSRRRVAGLEGEPWLHYLDGRGGAGGFTHGPAGVLASAPYSRDEEIDAPVVLELARRWIRRNL